MEMLCKIRDIYRSILAFEGKFEQQYGICLNEGMLLCSLSKPEQLSSGEIADLLGLTTSNTSKVIKSAECKGLIKRIMGEKDKRQMYFSLTDKGKECLLSINCNSIEMSGLLKTLIE